MQPCIDVEQMFRELPANGGGVASLALAEMLADTESHGRWYLWKKIVIWKAPLVTFGPEFF